MSLCLIGAAALGLSLYRHSQSLLSVEFFKSILTFIFWGIINQPDSYSFRSWHTTTRASFWKMVLGGFLSCFQSISGRFVYQRRHSSPLYGWICWYLTYEFLKVPWFHEDAEPNSHGCCFFLFTSTYSDSHFQQQNSICLHVPLGSFSLKVFPGFSSWSPRPRMNWHSPEKPRNPAKKNTKKTVEFLLGGKGYIFCFFSPRINFSGPFPTRHRSKLVGGFSSMV